MKPVPGLALALGLLAAAPAAEARAQGAAMQEIGTLPTPAGWTQFCSLYPEECARRSPDQNAVVLDRRRWSELEAVNRSVNHQVAPATDLEIFGIPEFWALPTDRGDCEDYALLKRKRLAERGWPVSALLVTLARLPNGGDHAVLTVRTDRGDFVLDSLDSRILPWTQTPYTYLERQSAEDPDRWMALSGDALAVVGTAETR